MKNNLSGIELLGREESMTIVGGGPTPAQLVASLTANIFTLTGGLTTSSSVYTQFVTELTDLAGTAVGYDMLNQILNAGLMTQPPLTVWSQAEPWI
jgi:hypothetical protein